MLSKEAQKALIICETISSRIITAQFKTRHPRIKLNIVQGYAPTNDMEKAAKEGFYERLQATLDKVKEREVTILMGDLNAKVGSNNTRYDSIMGKHGLGQINKNGEMFADFCAEHSHWRFTIPT